MEYFVFFLVPQLAVKYSLNTSATSGRHQVGKAVTARIQSTSTDALSALAHNIWCELGSIPSVEVCRADKASLVRTPLERE